MNTANQTAHSDDPFVSSRILLEQMISGMREGVIVIESGWNIYASNRIARSLLGGGVGDEKSLEKIISDEMVHTAFKNALENVESSETKFEIRVGNENRV